ncbi:MAG: hypothetical protein ACLPSW_29590 [Roseiarcus sp.]
MKKLLTFIALGVCAFGVYGCSSPEEKLAFEEKMYCSDEHHELNVK